MSKLLFRLAAWRARRRAKPNADMVRNEQPDGEDWG